MKKKIFLFAILAVTVSAALIVFHACEGFDFGGGNGVKNGEMLYSADPSSMTILSGKSENGDNLIVFGNKDKDGYPTAITGFQFKEKSSKKEGTITLEGGKIVKSETGEGVTILFDWLNNGEVAITMIDQETGEQFNTSYKPENKAAMDYSSQQPAMRNGNATLTVENYTAPEEAAVPDISTKAATKATGDIKGYIKVQKCGYPDDNADAYVSVYQDGQNPFNNFVATYKAKRVDKGLYEFTFPASTAAHYEINLAKYVESVDKLMGYVCTATSGSEEFLAEMCVPIAAALGATGIGLGVAGGFVAACATTIAGLALYCNTLGAGVPGGDDLLGAIAGKLDVKWDEPVIVLPWLASMPKTINGKARTVFVNKGDITEPFEFSSEEPTIALFQLSPAAPSSGQSYDAKAALKCVPAGAKVTMSIEGTDGYSDSKTETFDEAIYTTVVTLHVPGASKGVRDVCKVVVDLPNGDQLNKSASLVFGE